MALPLRTTRSMLEPNPNEVLKIHVKKHKPLGIKYPTIYSAS